jgi:hypothetical protein
LACRPQYNLLAFVGVIAGLLVALGLGQMFGIGRSYARHLRRLDDECGDAVRSSTS